MTQVHTNGRKVTLRGAQPLTGAVEKIGDSAMAKITVEWDTKVIEHHRVTVDSEGLPDHVLRALTDTSGDFEGDLEEFLADQEGEETLASSIVEDRCFDEATDE